MKYLIFSDIHNDEKGFSDLRAHSAFATADMRICLGDIINAQDTVNPNFFYDVAESTDEVILGNHEAVLIERCDVTVFNPKAQPAIHANVEQLPQSNQKFLDDLRRLPRQVQLGEAMATHGSFNSAAPWQHIRYTEDTQQEAAYLPAKINFLGHGHIPFIAWQENDFWYYDRQIYGKVYTLQNDRQYVVNCGSILGSREMRQYEKTFLTYDDRSQQIEFFNIGAA